jgi:hypothetical protein
MLAIYCSATPNSGICSMDVEVLYSRHERVLRRLDVSELPVCESRRLSTSVETYLRGHAWHQMWLLRIIVGP